MDCQFNLDNILSNINSSPKDISLDIKKYVDSRVNNMNKIKKINILYLAAKHILINLNRDINNILDADDTTMETEQQGKNIQEVIEFDHDNNIRYCFYNIETSLKSLPKQKEKILNKLSTSANLLRKQWGNKTPKKQLYVDACDSMRSFLVIDRPKVENRTCSINTDGLNFNILTKHGLKNEECLLKFFNYNGIQCMRVGNEDIFVGPYEIVEGKNIDQSSSRYCRRHSKNRPCNYPNCQYFHSPCINKKNANGVRRFMSFRFAELARFINNYNSIDKLDYGQKKDVGRDLIQAGWINIIRGYKLLMD